jgi:hypothetical protein
MPRGATITVENNFSQGLITEYTAMNFPENAVTAGDNVVFNELGRVTRRDGIDLEESGEIHDLSGLTNNEGAFVEFKWDSVGGTGTTSFVVQQMGSVVHFFQIGEVAISTELKDFSVDLTDYMTTTDVSLVANTPCQFTFGKGYLFIAHPFVDPLSISYDSDEDDISVEVITIEVRDFERLKDGLETDERPTALSNLHKYNLYNQGWYTEALVRETSDPKNVLEAWGDANNARSPSDYPSNADIWWIYKNGSEVAYFGSSNRSGQGYIGPSQVAMGNTPAPNGHYIYTAWNINRSFKSGISALPTETSGIARPSVIAFYAGRIFYAGVSADRYSDKLYFSQIIESDDQFGKCYQVNDPTSETTYDLLDSDGGVISLPLVSKIVSLQVLNDALIVVGTNGIFAIRGTDNGPFRATDYTVDYLSSTGGISNLSFINVDGSLIWWNYDAIYGLSPDQTGVSFSAQNVSKPTIQSLIDQVPADNRPYVKGSYNKKNRIVQWLYNDQIDASPYTYNRILEFNVVSKAFYTYTVTTDKTPRIVGLLSVSGQSKTTLTSNVTDNTSAIVTDNLLDDVYVRTETFSPNIESFKYATSGNIGTGGSPGFTYSSKIEGHQDWVSLGGSSFFSFFDSGYRIRGEMLRSFSSTPIAIVVDNIDDGEVIFKGIYDYGSRESMPQWLYVTARTQDALYNRHRGDYIIRRVKPRGKGKAFQLHFESDGDNPFSIVGWSTFDTGGQTP